MFTFGDVKRGSSDRKCRCYEEMIPDDKMNMANQAASDMVKHGHYIGATNRC